MTVSPQLQTSSTQDRWCKIGRVIVFLLLILGMLWILSLLHILDTSWAVLLSAIFTILSVLLALASWIWPRSVPTPALPVTAGPTQGELEVQVRPDLCGSTVYIDCGFHDIPPHNGRAMSIGERRNGNMVEFIAEDQTLDPGNYTVSINAKEPVAHMTILAGKRKRIDWRRICP